MFICSNCKQFASSIEKCEHCDNGFCKNCILIADDVILNQDPHFYKYTKLCSRCTCSNCIHENDKNLRLAYSKCRECKLRYCNDCFEDKTCTAGWKHG